MCEVRVGERCDFCEKPHDNYKKWLSNHTRYTTFSVIRYCLDHKIYADEKEAKMKARPAFVGNMWD